MMAALPEYGLEAYMIDELPNPHGWIRLDGVDGMHLVPLQDWRTHDLGPKCWCHPAHESGGLWSHNSMDRREEFERGRKSS